MLSMGFSEELAARAIAATGGKSIHKATEWILNDTQNSSSTHANPNPNPNSASPPTPFQPKLDRFFHSQSKLSSPSSQSQDQHQSKEESPPRKRPKQQDDEKSPPPPLPHEPLAERMRPGTVGEVVGQDHLLANNSLLNSAIDSNRLPSIVKTNTN